MDRDHFSSPAHSCPPADTVSFSDLSQCPIQNTLVLRKSTPEELEQTMLCGVPLFAWSARNLNQFVFF